jgi:hypothetical protein
MTPFLHAVLAQTIAECRACDAARDAERLSVAISALAECLGRTIGSAHLGSAATDALIDAATQQVYEAAARTVAENLEATRR